LSRKNSDRDVTNSNTPSKKVSPKKRFSVFGKKVANAAAANDVSIEASIAEEDPADKEYFEDETLELSFVRTQQRYRVYESSFLNTYSYRV
jgi:hypothetical protein